MSNIIYIWKTQLPLKNRAHGGEKIYRKPNPQITIDDFILPFSGKLSAENRWVQLAKIIPWDEKEYAFMFPSDRGNVAKPVRMALGSLMIQTRCGFTDRETVQQITENPYLQYFIGLKEYRLTRPFALVAMVKFRKRFNAKRLAKINERIIAAETVQKDVESETENHRDDRNNHPPDDHQGGAGPVITTVPDENEAETEETPKVTLNQGTLILDATYTPADLRYPTDLGLLNEAKKNSMG